MKNKKNLAIIVLSLLLPATFVIARHHYNSKFKDSNSELKKTSNGKLKAEAQRDSCLNVIEQESIKYVDLRQLYLGCEQRYVNQFIEQTDTTVGEFAYATNSF